MQSGAVLNADKLRIGEDGENRRRLFMLLKIARLSKERSRGLEPGRKFVFDYFAEVESLAVGRESAVAAGVDNALVGRARVGN